MWVALHPCVRGNAYGNGLNLLVGKNPSPFKGQFNDEKAFF